MLVGLGVFFVFGIKQDLKKAMLIRSLMNILFSLS